MKIDTLALPDSAINFLKSQGMKNYIRHKLIVLSLDYWMEKVF